MAGLLGNFSRVFLAGALVTLAACGGGGGGGGSPPPPPPPPAAAPLPEPEAARFLTQSTFGVVESELNALRPLGYSAWITQQIGLPTSTPHQAWAERRLVELRAANASANLGANQFYESFWNQAATAPDQLRQRVKFALSQIFVISLNDGNIDVRGAASYYDMLGKNAFGNFRTLLEDVTLHPQMGIYLTSLANQKENPATGRTPDENYAREVMQLMTIGLYKLNADGTVQTDTAGAPIPSYTPEDVSNLAKVFTGMSWYHPAPTNSTFFGGSRNADAAVTPMIFYSVYHSTSAKTFLGTTIPASTTVDGPGDLKVALDALFNHPNVGPFIGRRLIQQLVTSNPSPAYVGRVAAVFNNNGSGVRGDMGAVVRAVLLDSEARDMAAVSSQTAGKLREPIVRVANWMRAFGATSVSGNFLATSTSANTSLSQSPLASPSVFNFYRPGYVPPNTKLGAQNMTAPEFQIVDEVTVSGYLNTLQGIVGNGFGSGTDIRTTYSNEVAIANDPAALADRMNRLLMYGQMSSVLRTRIIDAVTSVAIPGGTATQAQIDAALLNRAKLAVFMTMASPDYLTQR